MHTVKRMLLSVMLVTVPAVPTTRAQLPTPTKQETVALSIPEEPPSNPGEVFLLPKLQQIKPIYHESIPVQPTPSPSSLPESPKPRSAPTIVHNYNSQQGNSLDGSVDEIKTLAQTLCDQTFGPGYTPTTEEENSLMRCGGIKDSDFDYARYIFLHESGFRYNAEEPKTHALGICQSLPGSKMSSAGSDYLTNIVTQIKWCNSYAISRYSSWYNAYIFWVDHHWW